MQVVYFCNNCTTGNNMRCVYMFHGWSKMIDGHISINKTCNDRPTVQFLWHVCHVTYGFTQKTSTDNRNVPFDGKDECWHETWCVVYGWRWLGLMKSFQSWGELTSSAPLNRSRAKSSKMKSSSFGSLGVKNERRAVRIWVTSCNPHQEFETCFVRRKREVIYLMKTHVSSNWIRLWSTVDESVVTLWLVVEGSSFFDSSGGFGCIRIKGNSATTSPTHFFKRIQTKKIEKNETIIIVIM